MTQWNNLHLPGGPPVGHLSTGGGGSPTYTGFSGVTQLPPNFGHAGSASSQAALHSSAPCRKAHATKRSSGHCGAAAHGHTHKVHSAIHHPIHGVHHLPPGIQEQPF